MARLYFRPLNPVALREMKARMRGGRTFALFGVYLALLALVVFVVYIRKGASATYNYGGSFTTGNYGPTRNFETGQDIFIAIFAYLIVVMSIITPTVCGGLISREMEERTYDMLLVTPVRGRSLVYGKLFSTLSYLMLMVVAAFPVACIVFIFGGVNLENLLAGFAIILMLTVVLGTMSLFFSALFRRTSLAIIVTYSLALLLLLGVPIVSNSIVTTINNDTSRSLNRTPPQIDPTYDFSKRMLVFNPFAALGSVLAPNAPYRGNREEDLQYFPNSRLFWGDPNRYFATTTFAPGTTADQVYRISRLPVLPNQITLWQGYLLVYTGLEVFFLLLGVGAVKPLPRRPGFNPLRGVTKLVKPRRRKTLTPALAVAIPIETSDSTIAEASLLQPEAGTESELPPLTPETTIPDQPPTDIAHPPDQAPEQPRTSEVQG